jgi:tetratricopeptide (TPR) repeat protein
MTMAADSGDYEAWLTSARALQAALQRADPDGTKRRGLWADIAAACDRVRLDVHSREGRMSEAERADAMVGPLLLDALDDEQVDVATVFTLTEAARSRVLLDTLAGAFHGESGDPREPDLVSRVVSFSPEVDTTSVIQELMLVSRVRHMEGDDSQADRVAELRALEALYARTGRGFQDGAGTASLSDVQAELAPSQVLVEYVIPFHPLHPAFSLFALVVTADTASVVPLTVPSKPEATRPIGSFSFDGRRPWEVSPLGLLVMQARSAVQGDDVVSARAWGRLLHRSFVEPVLASGAGDRDDWIVVPHRQMHACPWMALIDTDGLPWLATTAVTVCPSASVWLHLTPSTRAGHVALALGDPLVGYAGLPALPAAADEVEHLREIWERQGWHVDARTGALATAAALEAGAGAANVVHLATHGSFPTADAGTAHRLFLGLAPGSPGEMPLARIRALDLRQAWCTTLSICDGGIYLVGPGDELLGMAAALLEAGSSTVVAAQWKVDDDAGRRLMGHVMTALGTVGPARALRAGALALAAEGAPAKHWAAFIAIGNGNGPSFEREPESEPEAVQRFVRERGEEYGPGGSALDLARVLALYGDAAGTQSAYEQAIASGHPEHAPEAAWELGDMLAQAGDTSHARAAYQRAADSGHPEYAGAAALNLGVLLAEHGDPSGACDSYRRAIQIGRPGTRAKAALGLGLLSLEQGDLAGARSAFQLAEDSGVAEVLPEAARGLGRICQELGDVAGAEAAYQRAVDSGHPKVAPAAALNLAVLLTDLGEVSKAQAAYRIAIDSGDPELVPMAWIGLATLLTMQGDVRGTAASYQGAVDTGHPKWAPGAAHELGTLLEQHGDREAARAAYQTAIDLGYTEDLFLETGDSPETGDFPGTGDEPRRAKWRWRRRSRGRH